MHHKIFGELHAINGVSEEIKEGEVVVIVGPSGSGKSTFLRSLNLLEEPDRGHVYFEDVDITDKKVDINKHRQKMGMVFQHFNLFPHKTILDNITMAPIKLLGKSKEEAEKRTIAIRCFCPPDSWDGYAFAFASSPTSSSNSIARFSASSFDLPRSLIRKW